MKKEKREGEVQLHCAVPGLVGEVIQLIRSETDPDKRKLLDQYPELLSDEADDVLRQVEAAHRSHGSKEDADSIEGLRFKLGRTKLYGFEHACLEQVVLAAIVNLPDDNPGGYLAQITSRYPELLQPAADNAILALKGDLASGKDDDMGILLDLLGKCVREQRERYEAMGQGNRMPRTESEKRDSSAKRRRG